jgi:superfamily II DNA or RNA helicase
MSRKLPRDYQIQALDAFKKHYWLDMNRRGILNMFCGLGKSMALYLMMNCSYRHGSRVIIYCTPRIELILQITENFLEYHSPADFKMQLRISASGTFTLRDGVKMFDSRERFDENTLTVIVTTYCTFAGTKNAPSGKSHGLATYLARSSPVHAFIFDESHNIGKPGDRTGKCIQTLKKYAGSHVVFATATPTTYVKTGQRVVDPDSLDMTNEHIYGKIFYHLPYSVARNILDVSGNKVLSNYRVLFMDVEHQEVLNKIQASKMIGGTDKAHINEETIIAKWFLENALVLPLKKTIIYASTKKHAEKYSEVFKTLCGQISGLAVDERFKQAFSELKITVYHSEINLQLRETIKRNFTTDTAGKHVIISVQALNEGVDLPSCDSVLFTYDKKCSISTTVQNIGRTLRPDPQNPDKIAHIFLPTTIAEYEDHGNSKYFERARKVLTDLNSSAEPFYSGYENVRVPKRSKKEIVGSHETTYPEGVAVVVDSLNIGTAIWDPVTGLIEKLSGVFATKSITETTPAQMRAIALLLLGDSPITTAVKSREVLNYVGDCHYKCRCPCLEFTSWDSIVYGYDVPTFEMSRSVILPYRNEFIKKYLCEVADVQGYQLREGCASEVMDVFEEIGYQRHDLDAAETRPSSPAALFKEYVVAAMLRDVVNSRNAHVCSVPPIWTWPRVYAAEKDSGVDVLGVCAFDTVPTARGTPSRVKTINNCTFLGAKSDRFTPSKWVSFKLHENTNAEIVKCLTSITGTTISNIPVASIYSVDRGATPNLVCTGRIEYASTEGQRVFLTLHGKITYDESVITARNMNNPESKKLLDILKKLREEIISKTS